MCHGILNGALQQFDQRSMYIMAEISTVYIIGFTQVANSSARVILDAQQQWELLW